MQAALSWTSVVGALKYQIFRTEGTRQCGQGKVLVATLSSSTLAYTNSNLSNGREYYFIVVPKGSNEACFGPSSSCTAVTPLDNPTQFPTKTPTSHPPSTSPSNAPSSSSTTSTSESPSNLPSKQPTLVPSKYPSVLQTITPVTTSPDTNIPSLNPMFKPSSFPGPKLSSTPTHSLTNMPTNTSTFPTVTTAPTLSGNGEQQASFDTIFGAPRCLLTGSSCDSGTLVQGRGVITNGKELNLCNTIDGCADGNTGLYRSDESLEKIIVRSGEVNGTGSVAEMSAGGRATIVASVFAWGSGASNVVDFFYSMDASSPNWQYIGSVTPPGGQDQEILMAYTLPHGTNQAVRVQIRYGGSIEPCASGYYNDRDDLVFGVKTVGQPTASPSTKSPTNNVGGGPQVASYDSILRIPRCSSYGTQCDSLGLLDGRGTMRLGNEPNAPNTLGSCVDGNSGKYHWDESIDKIVVRSGEVDGSGSGVTMAEGGRATIIATVHPFSTGTANFADFYYASNLTNPLWKFIGTKQPASSGIQELKVSYTMPVGTHQAVRVNFRFNGVQGANGACCTGSYGDTDDLAFEVKQNLSFTVVDVYSEGIENTKDFALDSQKRTSLNMSENRRRSKRG